jgi:DNA-binding GntR family transcriptional regulator
MSETDIRDQYELRARLEQLAAERAATRMGADAIATLDAAIAEFDQGIELMSNGSADAGLRRITAANSAFHQAIVERAQHRRLSALLEHAVDIPLVYQVFHHQNQAERQRSNLCHRMVRNAIAAGEPQRAGALMAEHILQGRDSLLELRSQPGCETETHAS